MSEVNIRLGISRKQRFADIMISLIVFQIVTDGLLVRGIYSTVTLAVYGHIVSDVKIKELEDPKKEPVLSPQSSISNSPPPVADSPELRIECEGENKTWLMVDCFLIRDGDLILKLFHLTR